MAGRIGTFVESTTEKFRGLIDRFLEVRIVESSVVLAAQAFLALFPLIIIVYAIIPSGAANGLLHQLQTRIGLSGESQGAVEHLTTSRDDLQNSLSWLSVLVVIGSATSFTRALQRVYQYAWGLPKLGIRGLWRGIVWLVGVIAYLAVIGGVVHLVRNGDVTKPVSIVFGFVLWWWTQFLLLGGRVKWRALLPGALLTAVVQGVLGLIAAVYVPREVRSNEANYGPIGAVFALESWFIVVAGAIVASAAIGAAMCLAKGKLGEWSRGSADPDGWRREVPPLRFYRRRGPSD